MSDVLGTIFSCVAGGGLGAVLRLVPEGIKMFTAWQDNRQQLAILKLQGEQQAAGQRARLDEIGLQGQISQAIAAIQGAVDATKATGIKSVDTLNGMFRPVVSFWFFGIYALFKTAALVLWIITLMMAMHDGGWTLLAIKTAIAIVKYPWTDQDMAMLSGILSFWFLGRAISTGR